MTLRMQAMTTVVAMHCFRTPWGAVALQRCETQRSSPAFAGVFLGAAR